MESVGDVLKRQPSRFHYQDLVQKIMKDPDVAAFIQQESLTPEELNRSISKFNQYITERDKFLRGDTDYIAKGYKPILVMNHGYADVSYEETPELIAAEKEAAIKNRLKLINLPASLRKASLAQVDLDDLGRLPVFEKLLAFVEQYPTILKGLYLYGDFGVGKSFMVAALAHDLSERRGVSSTLLHYPSFVIDVKNAIGDGNVKTLVDEIKLSEVLILDDIGAEQSTAWVRDEILQFIQFNKESTTCYNTTKFFNHFDSCLNSSTCCQEVIYDKNTLTWLDGIRMHSQGINTVLFFIVSRNDFTWQFPWLTNRRETNSQLKGNWTAHDKTTSLRTYNHVDFLVSSILNDFTNSVAISISISHQRTDITKSNTFLWIIFNCCNVIF